MNEDAMASVENGAHGGAGNGQPLLQEEQFPQFPEEVGKSDWLDVGDFASLVCELKATWTQAEKWIIVQHYVGQTFLVSVVERNTNCF